MKSKPTLDLDKIARGLGAERGGEVRATGGYYGAVQLAAEVSARFKAPPGGGRGTDPSWSVRDADDALLADLARPRAS